MSVHKHICTAVLLLCAVAIANNTNEIVATHYDNTEAITIPKLLHYQGKLTTLAGLPVTDSTYSITFRLFNTLTGGSSFWNETQNIATNQGIFNVLLGTNNSIDTIPQSGNCYLEMQVNPNPAMTPRIRLVSSAYAYLSKKADTSNYALSANIQYVDSARIATNAHKLQGKDTIALSAKFVDEGQTNAITNTMITDNAVTSAKIQDGTIQLVDLAFTPATRPLTPGVSSSEILDGAISNFKIQANAVTTDKISDGTIIRQDVASTFKAPYADTSDYVRNVTLNYVDSARVATNAHKLQGKDTLALSNKFVDEGQANSITSAMIVDGTITNADISATAGISDIKLSGTGALITNLNADLLDGQHASAFALTNHTHAYVDSARISTNTYKLQGKDTLALSAKFVDEGQVNAISNAMITDNAIISSKIQDGTILRQDVAATFKAPYADTSDYVRNINITYVDSARVATNAHKLQGKDTTALDARYVNEGQTSSITSSMITDGTIIRDDVAPVFKAPYSDTADYARSTPPVGYIDSARVALDAYNAFKLQGQDTSDLSIKFINNGQTAGGVLTGTYPNPILKEAAVFSVHIADSTIDEIDIKDNAISSAKIINGTILREDVATNFKAPYADTSDYIRNLSVTYVDSARVSTNAHKLQGKDTTALDARYVNEGQVSSVNSAMILDLTITNADISNVAGISDVKLSGSGAIVSNFNADMLDGQHASAFSLTGHIHPYVDSARVSTNTYKLQGKDTLALSAKFVDENQTNAISTAMIIDGNVTMPKINQSGASTGQVIKWTGSSWAPSNDSIGTGIFLPLAGGTMTGAITSTGDPEITMGKANFGSGNLNTGIQAFVTGINNRARGHFSVVSGGGGGFHVADSNSAIGNYSTVGGGSKNIASGLKSTISGGDRNSATNEYTTVGGGVLNTASGGSATVSGGSQNIANNFYGTVSGGLQNSASGNTSTIGGGFADTANAMYSGVFSGCNNLAGDEAADTAAVVVGGRDNRATGKYTF
ncbi:MAG: hypothetical protein KGZ86_05595, partial [Candidatus Latescibacteria bacterium]|nr:hypothetical protein [Candidatus Latescibacterota bacterium]